MQINISSSNTMAQISINISNHNFLEETHCLYVKDVELLVFSNVKV